MRVTPAWAISPIQGKRYKGLSIKPIYITTELSRIGNWSTKVKLLNLNHEGDEVTAIVKVGLKMTIDGVTTSYQMIGSSKNVDPGDAAKGAVTDCLSKLASYFGVCQDVWSNRRTIPPTLLAGSPEYKRVEQELKDGKITMDYVFDTYWGDASVFSNLNKINS